jgi:hypothetical protein
VRFIVPDAYGKLIVKRILALSLPGLLCANAFAPAAETNSVSRPGRFEFDRTISRQTLDSYLSGSVTMEGLLQGRGDLDDHICMIKHIGSKYIGRTLCLWNAENDFTNNLERAREAVLRVRVAICMELGAQHRHQRLA